MVSGGYDPLHVGHIRQINEAAWHGHVLVVLNTDKWLMEKKGYVFMPYHERKEILSSLRAVWRVEPQIDTGSSVTDSIRYYRPDIFAKGGDRNPSNMPRDEVDVCEELGIEILYGIGGDKVQSSSWLIDHVRGMDV